MRKIRYNFSMDKETVNVVINNKDSLVKHIIKYYYNNNKTIISPIKLQKCLYFLFAIWGGYVLSSRNGKNEDKDSHNYSEYLFDDDFSVWEYGPVDEKAYNWFENFNDNEIEQLELLKKEDLNYKDEDNNICSFINEMLNKLFNISDFGLVDLSHDDDVWKDAISNHKNKLERNMIITEYERRLTSQ